MEYKAEDFISFIENNRRDKVSPNGLELIAKRFRELECEVNKLSLGAVSGSLPTEEQVLQTIFDCVFIRGIELEDYKRNFTNEQSGLYDALVKLFSGNDR
jgi:hypothetical protein